MLLGNAHLTQSTKRWKDGQVPFCGGNVIWEQGEILRSKYYLGYGSKYRIVQEGYLYKEKWNKGQGTTLCENELSIIMKKNSEQMKKKNVLLHKGPFLYAEGLSEGWVSVPRGCCVSSTHILRCESMVNRDQKSFAQREDQAVLAICLTTPSSSKMKSTCWPSFENSYS